MAHNVENPLIPSFASSLSESISKEKTRSWVGIAVFVSAVIGSISVYLWRCRFGADLTDEAFYIIPAWKNFLMGDRPFANEYLNGMRQFDILNFLLIRPWLPYSILAIRRAAVLVYALLLLFYTQLFFKKKMGLTASLAFVLCLTFDYFLMPTWSYNWWVRDMVLLHHSLLFLAKEQPVYRKKLLFGAGFALGVAVVAYNSLLPTILMAGLILGFGASFFDRRQPNARPKRNRNLLALPYILGAVTICFPDALYLLTSYHPWLASVRAMVTMSDYAGGGVPHKILELSSFLFRRWELWALLVTLVVFDSDAAWTTPLRDLEYWPEKWEKVRKWIFAPLLILILSRFYYFKDPAQVLGDYVALGACGAIVLAFFAWVHNDIYLLLSVSVSLMVAASMAISSANSYLAFFWVMPSLIIPFLACETDDVTARLRPFHWQRVTSEGLGHTLLLLFVGYVSLGTFWYQRNHTYYDVPPGNCTERLSMAPLEGVQTSPRRAFLIQKIAELVELKPFVLTFSEISGPLLFSKARPSMDTGLVERVATDETNRRSLLKMWQENRLPSIIIKAKIRPWYWGIQHPLAHIPMEYKPTDLMVRFTNCVRDETLASFEEFDAYSVKADMVGQCVDELTGGSSASQS